MSIIDFRLEEFSQALRSDQVMMIRAAYLQERVFLCIECSYS
jgi:hypothetical protein